MEPIISKQLLSSAESVSEPDLPLPFWREPKRRRDSGTIRFTTVQDLFKVIDCTTRDCFTVRNVSPHSFTEIDIARENEHRKFRVRFYDSGSQILIITIPTGMHEQLHQNLYHEIVAQIREMGLRSHWKNIGSERFKTTNGSGKKGKEGDSAGGPRPQRANKGAWPTLVIEAGCSETLEELQQDMRRWFDISDHMVKIVLLVKFDGTTGTIFLERWEEEVQVRPGATGTRRSHHPHPTLQQEITITRNTSTNPVSYQIISGALVLQFKLLFLREPGPKERDIIIDVPVLLEFAEYIWNEV